MLFLLKKYVIEFKIFVKISPYPFVLHWFLLNFDVKIQACWNFYCLFSWNRVKNQIWHFALPKGVYNVFSIMHRKKTQKRTKITNFLLNLLVFPSELANILINRVEMFLKRHYLDFILAKCATNLLIFAR